MKWMNIFFDPPWSTRIYLFIYLCVCVCAFTVFNILTWVKLSACWYILYVSVTNLLKKNLTETRVPMRISSNFIACWHLRSTSSTIGKIRSLFGQKWIHRRFREWVREERLPAEVIREKSGEKTKWWKHDWI